MANAASADPRPERKSEGGTGERAAIGEAPVDVSELFLRQATVLLEPGEGQYDIGFSYTWDETKLPIVLSNSTLAVENIRQRFLVAPLSVRYGIATRTECFLQVPLGVAIFEQANFEDGASDTEVGIGDLDLGVKYQLHKEKADAPDVIGAISCTIPTGGDPYEGGAALGSGFWAISGDLNFVKSYDPIVVFSGLGYTHQFARSFDGVHFEPGEIFRYSLGLGFSVNDDLVLSSEFFAQFQSHTSADGRRIPNTLVEPFAIRFALTRVLSRTRFCEPFVGFGLNDDAPAVQFGVAWTSNFGQCAVGTDHDSGSE